MTTSNNQQTVAVKPWVNAGDWSGSGDEHTALTSSHNETVAVKTRVNAGKIDGRAPETNLEWR
jgi:hypothetical protein